MTEDISQPVERPNDPDAALRLDGAARAISERWIEAERLSNLIGAAVVIVGGVVGVVIVMLAGLPTLAWSVVMIVGLVVVSVVLVWLSIAYPPAAYVRMGYAVNERGIEIRGHSLLYWRRVISVPKQRVQHTDVEQGPLMRRYSISKLTIHTAGTQHATVTLYGVDEREALQIRDHLIGKQVGNRETDDGG